MNFNLPFFKFKKFGLSIFAISICFAICSCEKSSSKKTVESTIKTKKHSERFLVYEVNPKKVNLKFYWKDNKNRVIGSLENLKNFVEAKNERLKFAMNGGMFAENQIPKGLYIENFKILKPIDTLSGEGNFYLKPNGIFIINKDKSASIVTTENFKINSEINYATQSGPMLLINGKINDIFKHNSTNLNTRNGVGIREDGSLVFAMSKNKVNFYEFANFFKSRNCINALYLDGFVSRVYLPEESWTQKDGNFGVIIGVTE